MRRARPIVVAPSVIAGIAASLAIAAGCATHASDLAARVAGAREVSEYFGYAPYGASTSGTVADGKEARIPLPLKEGCYQILAFPGAGLKGVDVSLLDPSGQPSGKGTRGARQSAVRRCVQPSEAGAFTLVIESVGGAGGFVAQPYAARVDHSPAQARAPTTEPSCEGPDCDAHADLATTDECNGAAELGVGASATGGGAVAVAHGSTARRGGTSVRFTCGASDSPAAVFRVHADSRRKLVVDLSAKFDAVVALYRATNDGYLCEPTNEIECSDDAEGVTNKSHIEAVVDTGDYGIAVGGFDGDRGEFELRARMEDAPSLEGVCAAAKAMVPGTRYTDVLEGSGSIFHARCAATDGDEVLYRLNVDGARSRVRVVGRAQAGGELTLSLRGRCDDPSSEVACSSAWHFDGVSWTGLLGAGAYTVFADGSDAAHGGPIELSAEIAPEGGSGTAEGDGCKAPRPLSATNGVPGVTLDTFHAKSDVRVSCAAEDSSDVVFKLDVAAKSRVTLSSPEDEGRHVAAVQRACGDVKGELACDYIAQAKGVDALLDPGAYFVIVKGKGAEDFGRAKLTMRTREVAAATLACKSAPRLMPGKPVGDTTKDAPDRFASVGCGGPMSSQQSGDRVYQFTLRERSHANVSLKGTSYYGVTLSLRTDCSDPARGELVCANASSKMIDRDLDPGTYYVVVDGAGSKLEGTFSIELTVGKAIVGKPKK